jgi:hypothetical protein
VTTDGKQGGTILPSGYPSVRLDDGRLVPLPHPIETGSLEKQGFTWRQASKEKRLYRIEFKRQLTEGHYGCTLALIAWQLFFF